jgi:hypothetical protein
VLWKDLPALLDDVGQALASIDQEYAEYLAEERLTVTAAAQVALLEMVESAEQRLIEVSGRFERAQAQGQPSREPGDELLAALGLFEAAGRDHFRRGRPLRDLLLAYQAGGQVAWRHMAGCAVRVGFPADALAALAESLFRAIDRIGTVTTNGYLLEQAESAGMQERLRNTLAEQLLVEGADPGVLAELARQVGWTLPAEAAVVLVPPGDQAALTALARLSTTCLVLRTSETPGLVVPDPRAPGTRQLLLTVLHGCRAVVGPAVPLRGLPRSAAITRDAMRVREACGVGDSVLFVDEHLDSLIVHRDEQLLDAWRRRCLAPLQGAGKGSRDAFRDTLRAWLLHMGDRRAVAEDLHVHPQTVRYRMSRLHELFGPVLDEPEGRRRLLLALAWDEPVGGQRPSRAVPSPRRAAAAGPRSRAREPGAGATRANART